MERRLDVQSLHEQCIQTPGEPLVWHLLQASSLMLTEHGHVQVGLVLPLH